MKSSKYKYIKLIRIDNELKIIANNKIYEFYSLNDANNVYIDVINTQRHYELIDIDLTIGIEVTCVEIKETSLNTYHAYYKSIKTQDK